MRPIKRWRRHLRSEYIRGQDRRRFEDILFLTIVLPLKEMRGIEDAMTIFEYALNAHEGSLTRENILLYLFL